MTEHYEAIFVKIPVDTIANSELGVNELHQLSELTKILDPELRDFRAQIVGMTSNLIEGKVVYTIVLKKQTQSL